MRGQLLKQGIHTMNTFLSGTCCGFNQYWSLLQGIVHHCLGDGEWPLQLIRGWTQRSGDWWHRQRRQVDWLPVHSSPQLGEISPQMGDSSPHMGEISPHMGAIYPHIGDSSPHMGHSSPQMGEISPQMGEISPHMGDSSPHMGESSPQMGEISPHMEDSSPHMEEISNHPPSPTCHQSVFESYKSGFWAPMYIHMYISNKCIAWKFVW